MTHLLDQMLSLCAVDLSKLLSAQITTEPVSRQYTVSSETGRYNDCEHMSFYKCR